MSIEVLMFESAAAVSMLAAGPVQALENIRLGRDWVPAAGHFGFVYAKATGLWEQAWLEIEIGEVGPGTKIGPPLAGGGSAVRDPEALSQS